MDVDEYIKSRLKRLSGKFDIYINNDKKFLHKSERCKINIDTNFWKFVKTVSV